MMKKTKALLGLLVLLVSLSCLAQKLNPGPWRFELKTEHADIPFIIHFTFKNNKLMGELHNGKEIILLPDIIYSANKLIIPLQTYEATLELIHETPSLLRGHHIRHNKSPKVLTPLTGIHGHDKRYSGEERKAQINLQGRWEVTLIDSTGEKSPGIVVFKQSGNEINGTILTTTGDYRYFEGIVSGSTFEAASFDGVFNYLFKGELKQKKLEATILGSSVTKVHGQLNPKASLPDAYKLTQVKNMSFKFPDIRGKRMVSLADKQFRNKPVIIQIFGSWCPNCMDEMNFLIPWYKENAPRGIEVMALAFERSLDEQQARQQLLKVQHRKNVPYTMLHAGSTAEDRPAEKLPGIKNFISFPTTIFLNRQHQVIKVHAGFAGPSTGEFYQTWKKEFNATANQLLK